MLGDDFHKWAFGDLWHELVCKDDAIGLMKKWNELHGDKLVLAADDRIDQSLQKMKKLYEEHNANLHANGSQTATKV